MSDHGFDRQCKDCEYRNKIQQKHKDIRKYIRQAFELWQFIIRTNLLMEIHS